MKNKNEEIIKSFYDNYEEDLRFSDNAHKVEFVTTMRYIDKFLKPNSKVLEIGAGTGQYSIALAKAGFDVYSVELVQSNLDVLLKNSKRLKNIHAEQGDALDLSRFEDNTFDMVLNLGPMYHLYTDKEAKTAISEALRVAKKGAIVMFAYLNNSALWLEYGVLGNVLDRVEPFKMSNFGVKRVPKEVFATYWPEDFFKLFKNTKSKFVGNVAVDGVAPFMKEKINELSPQNYASYLNFHFFVCEKQEFWGASSHMLYICKKL